MSKKKRIKKNKEKTKTVRGDENISLDNHKKNEKGEKKTSVLNDLKLAFFLSWKSIQRGNKSSLVLVIGIMMVVFLNLLFTDAIFAGIVKGIDEQKIDYQYGEVLIEPIIGEQYITRADEIVNTYKDNANVLKITKEVIKMAKFTNEKEGDGRNFETLGANLHNLSLKDVFEISSKIIDGRMLLENDFGKIMIGSSMAGGYPGSMTTEDLGIVRPGDKIKVEVDGNVRDFEIIGIFKTKSSALDKDAIIVDKDIYSLVGGKNLASDIVIRLKNRNDSSIFLDNFKKSNFNNYRISDWVENTASGAGVSKSFEMIGSILRVIGALVAGLVIFIIIFVDIVNKRRQVGILKAIGINEKIVINSYIIRGVFYTILGSIFGYLLMEYVIVAAFKNNPIDLPMGDVIPLVKDSSLSSSVIFFVLAGLVGSAVPAYKEIKKKILDLLYH